MPITLIISIDGVGNDDVEQVANSFLWEFGPKQVIVQSKKLGLKEHILWCTGLVEEYENVIILEDDLWVSPYFYHFALKAIEFYKEDIKVSGISLYNYQVSEFSSQMFDPVNDGSDVYFMQLPSSWGQVITKKQWRGFMGWYQQNKDTAMPVNIPNNVKQWGNNSWKKHFIHYMVANDLYFVFPRVSFTTNFEEFGTNSDSSGKYQVPVQNTLKEHSLCALNDSLSVYDSFYEIKPETLNKWTPELSPFNYTVNLNGLKEHISTEFVLTQHYSSTPVLSYSSKLTPLLHNVIYHQEGSDIVLAKVQSIKKIFEDDCSTRFFILIPILVFDVEMIKITLNSLLVNGYANKKLVLLSSTNYLSSLKELINDCYYTNRFQLDVLVSEADTEEEHLKNGFKSIKSGVVTWVKSGSVINISSFHYINKAFKLDQTNAILVTNSNTNIEDYRFTKESIIYILSKGYEQDPQNLFFRAGCWEKIQPYFLSNYYNNSMFFQILLLSLVIEMNLSPMVIEGYPEKMKHFPRIQLQKDFLPITKIPEGVNGFWFSFFKWSFNRGIPVLKRFYRFLYELPLVIRVDQESKHIYFSSK